LNSLGALKPEAMELRTPRQPSSCITGITTPQRCSPPCTPTKPLWIQRCEDACAQCQYPCSFALDQSSKREDRLALASADRGRFFVAVFDGHRGAELGAMAAPEALLEVLRRCQEMARQDRLQGGSTAVLLATDSQQLCCCSVGDSRAVARVARVAAVPGGTLCLTREHSCQVPEEVERIAAAAGCISFGRVGGVLPMTRGLGNFDLEAAGFACIPDVMTLPLMEVSYVVVASDGLWDVISDEECCALVSGGCTAEGLVREARQRGSSDDVAVVVTHFPPLGAAGA